MSRQAFRLGLAALVLATAAALAAQEIQHETRTIAIEVPVRVFKGDTFIDHLTIADFEIYEDGRPQTLDAVYLVKKAAIERQEGTRGTAPDTGRHFILFFEMTEYDPRVRDALAYFVNEVLGLGDEFVVVTPLKTYRMKSDILKTQSRSAVFEKILGLLRRDILVGSATYNDIIEELTGLAATMSASIGTASATQGAQSVSNPFSGVDSLFDVNVSVEEQLQLYAASLSRLESLRSVDEARVMGLATHLGSQPGQKELFLFYQREFIPEIDPSVLTMLMSYYNDRPEITQAASGIFDFYRRETPLDIEPVKRAFSDSGASIHFLYLSRPAPKVRGVSMEERSEDLFAPFLEMSRATGGFVSSTANIGAAMKAAVAASENYYLLYYTPKDYKADGAFHALEVRVKASGCRTSYRLGYIAD